MHNLKQSLERLRCDLHVLLIGKKLNKDNSKANESDFLNGEETTQQEQSTDSEKMVTEQIQQTLDIILKIEQSLQADINGEDLPAIDSNEKTTTSK